MHPDTFVREVRPAGPDGLGRRGVQIFDAIVVPAPGSGLGLLLHRACDLPRQQPVEPALDGLEVWHAARIGGRLGGPMLLLVLLTLCCLPAVAAEPASEPAPDAPKVAGSEVSIAMHRHLTLAEKLRDAVIAGDLDAAREAGRVLARQPPIQTVPKDWEPWLLQIRESAGRVEDAWDLETAGRTTAEIARVCASCHLVEQAGPSFPEATAPTADHRHLKHHMQHHVDATNLMWEGLISGDDARYTLGAKALAEAKYEEAVGAPKDDDTVHELGAYGARVRGVAARADTYGAVLATCARCHTTMRK